MWFDKIFHAAIRYILPIKTLWFDNLLDRWLDYELASLTLIIVVGRKHKSAQVNLLPAPAEEVLPAFCFSAREGLGDMETRSCVSLPVFARKTAERILARLVHV